MSDQLEFTPFFREYNEMGKEEVVLLYDLDLLPPNEEFLRGKIDPDTYRSIKASGQWQPILIATLTSGEIAIIDGEQRVKIQRKLGRNAQIPAIMHPERLEKLQVEVLRSHMNNARQENPVADILNIRNALDQWPSMSIKGLSVLLGMKQGRVRSLSKQARMPQMLIDAVSNGTMSRDTLADLSKKPRSVQKKAENKYREEREKIQVIEDDETGEKVFKRLEDDHIFAKPPSLLTANDVKDLQRVSVANKVKTVPLGLKVELEEAITGFAAVNKDNKFMTDVLGSADEVRLEIGRKKGRVVTVRSI